MKSLFWFCVGVVVGLFMPTPYGNEIRTWLLNTWHKFVN